MGRKVIGKTYPPKWVFTDDMGEISGFGGGYEACCRAMLKAGGDWLDAHPNADPQFHGFEGVYGLIMEDNEDAKSLSHAVVEAAEDKGGATGAQHQAVVGDLLYIRKNGWEKFVDEVRKRELTDQLNG